jgi:hypothetical protein
VAGIVLSSLSHRQHCLINAGWLLYAAEFIIRVYKRCRSELPCTCGSFEATLYAVDAVGVGVSTMRMLCLSVSGNCGPTTSERSR